MSLRKNNFSLVFLCQFIAVCVASIYAALYRDLSFIIGVLLILFMALLFFRRANDKTNLRLFSLFFMVYIACSIFIYLGYIDLYGVPYHFADEKGFYTISFYQLSHFHAIPYLLPAGAGNDLVSQKLQMGLAINWVGYYYLLGYLGKAFNAISFNSFMALKLSSVVAGIVTVIYTYQLSKLFLSIRSARVVAIIVGVLPYSLFYNSVLMRDPIIAAATTASFFYAAHYCKVHMKSSLLKLFLSLVVLASFRLENGIFIAVMLLGYITRMELVKITSYLKAVVLGCVVIFAMIMAFCFFIKLYIWFNTINSNYINLASHSADSGSVGIKLNSLIFPLNVLSKFLYSQLQPFPFWVYFQNSYPRILDSFGGLVWSCILPMAAFVLFIRKLRVKLKKDLVLLGIIAFAYLLLVSYTQPSPRRLFAVYPIITLLSYYGYMSIRPLSRMLFIVSSLSFYTLLTIFYLLIFKG